MPITVTTEIKEETILGIKFNDGINLASESLEKKNNQDSWETIDKIDDKITINSLGTYRVAYKKDGEEYHTISKEFIISKESTPDTNPDTSWDSDSSSRSAEIEEEKLVIDILLKEKDDPTKASTVIISKIKDNTASLRIPLNTVIEAIKKAKAAGRKVDEEDGISLEIEVDTKNSKASNLSADLSNRSLFKICHRL